MGNGGNEKRPVQPIRNQRQKDIQGGNKDEQEKADKGSSTHVQLCKRCIDTVLC